VHPKITGGTPRTIDGIARHQQETLIASCPFILLLKRNLNRRCRQRLSGLQMLHNR
jgi:hypothetical protein